MSLKSKEERKEVDRKDQGNQRRKRKEKEQIKEETNKGRGKKNK
jgi:hypothetical protein